MAFTPTLTKDKGNIKKKSGGIWKIAASTDAGPSTSLAAADWGDLGFVKVNSKRNKVDRIKDYDESGKLVVDEKGNVDRGLSITLMQTDAALVEFIRNTADTQNTFYALYHYDGIANAKRREELYPICKIASDFEINSDNQEMVIQVSILDNDTAITFGGTGNAALPTGAYATSVVVAVNTGWKIQETAVA